MVLINAIFTLVSLLWLISEIMMAEVDSGLWFALAFTLLCAANTVNLLGGGKRRSRAATNTSRAARPDGEPVADRPDVPAAYGVVAADKGQGLLDWSEMGQQLAAPVTYWLCTTRPDGRPHAVPVWGVWLDNAFYFGTHRHSAKARNLAANPYLSLHLDDNRQVLIVEGPVSEIVDSRERFLVDQAMARKYDLADDNPAEDPNPVFSMRPKVAFAWSGEDYGATATRWRFDQ
jgi:nitroimidazol reductase NimA-like FMN-containing flavoprotein (pyridoxamine 5'-phosphate oxidase superfamily)